MDRGGAWDQQIDKKLSVLFGGEAFEPKLINLTWNEKSKFFKPYIEKIKNRSVKIVTIAGTNGKGETARSLKSQLNKLGQKVALWTSPHILSVRERFMIDEDMISRSTFEQCLEKHLSTNLSFYEVLFLIFCDWASEVEDLDVVILEVGLGGRLDSTNYFDADLTCLTSISRDHCELLGDSLEEILIEKLGICRKGVTLISGLTSEHLNKKILEFTSKLEIPWINLKEEAEHYSSRPYWEKNTLMSLAAAEKITRGDISTKLYGATQIPAPVISPGRFEEMTTKNRRFIFIGAHNLDGLRCLLKSVFSRIEVGTSLEVLFSISKRPDEEITAMLELLQSCGRIKNNLTLCSFKHPKAVSPEKLASLLSKRESEGKGKIKLAENWNENIDKENKGTTLVLGSYYFIGEVQKYILSIKPDSTCSRTNAR